MNKMYEVELKNVKADFMPSEFDLVLGVELESSSSTNDFTEFNWQIVYARIVVDDCWHFLPQTLYDQIDETLGDKIINEIWCLSTNS